MHNLLIVRFFVNNLRPFRDQFLDHIGKVLWQGFSYLGAGIFGGSLFAHLYQPVQSNLIPFLHVGFLFSYQIHFFLWIVDQRCQGSLFPFT